MSRYKIARIVLILAALVAATHHSQNVSYIDFSELRFGTRPDVRQVEPELQATSTRNLEDGDLLQLELRKERADYYLDTATRDYYQGSYDEAIRRLEIAKKFDPTNYDIFRLSGQIFFERNELRKAFNDWATATQLPNNDQSINRDLDVLRHLIRYSRIEIDRLRRDVHKNPGDNLSVARLRELEKQVVD